MENSYFQFVTCNDVHIISSKVFNIHVYVFFNNEVFAPGQFSKWEGKQ